MTEDDEKYNGWVNRETWAVSLWLSNDEGSYNHLEELKTESIEEAKDNIDQQKHLTLLELAQWKLSEKIKAYVEELNEFRQDEAQGKSKTNLEGMFSDIGSLWRVEYEDIAENELTKDDIKQYEKDNE